MHDKLRKFERDSGLEIFGLGAKRHLWEAALEKYAELIVRQCAELYNHDDVLAPVGQSAWGEAYQDGWIEGTKIYRETILEHFGVEE